MIDDVKKLRTLLDKYDAQYYVNGNSDVSDPEYDALKKRYHKLSKTKEYDHVPGGTSGKKPKRKHDKKIYSLAKVNTEEDLKDNLKKLWPVVIEPKYDGMSLTLYKNGDVVTRGTGEEGDILLNLGKQKHDFTIRFEAIIMKNTFKEINEIQKKAEERVFKNARNAVAGILRNDNKKFSSKVQFMGIDILNSNMSYTFKKENIESIGFKGASQVVPKTIEEAVNSCIYFEKIRDKLPYDIDGVVIKSNIHDSEKKFGFTGHHPKNAIAYKFATKSVETIINSVTWQVGRSGKITPVAELNPIDLYGTEVTRATLHNIDYIEGLKVGVGCKVLVTKANEIIPAVVGCINPEDGEKIIAPVKCPLCDSALKKINDQHFCLNDDCKAKHYGLIRHMAKREALNIDGLSEETAIKIIRQLNISPFDVFELTVEDVKKLDGYAQRSAEKLVEAINKSKSTTFERFIYACGIPTIGRSAAKALAARFSSLVELLDDIEKEGKICKDIKDFGQTMINNLIKYKHRFEVLRTKLIISYPVIRLVTEDAKKFVITGSFEKTRPEIKQLIEQHGHKVSSSVSKKTDYVLVGKDPGGKFTKARKLGITVLNTLDELSKVL